MYPLSPKNKCPAGIRQDTQKHRRTTPVSYKRFCRSLCTELKNLFDGHYKGCAGKMQAYFQNLPKCRTCPMAAREFCDIRQELCLQTAKASLIKIILIFPCHGGITEPAAEKRGTYPQGGNKMKKTFAFILVLSMALALCACGGEGTGEVVYIDPTPAAGLPPRQSRHR